jgi:signal transduction histidine kinase
VKRLTLSLLFVVVTAILGLGWVMDQWYSAQYAPTENPAIQNYRQLGRQLVALIEYSNADETILSNWAKHSPATVELTPYGEFPVPQNIAISFENGEPLLLDSGSGVSLHYFLRKQHSVLSLRFPAVENLQIPSSLSWCLTLLFYFGVIVIVLLWLLPLLKRLHLLRKSAKAFGAGDLSVRIPLGSVSYIAEIEQEFNRMAQQVEHLVADNKLLSRGLSHDLRTPLARLRFGLDVLEEADLTIEQKKTLAHLNRDLIAMEALVETLLGYARLEQGKINFSVEPLNLADFVLNIVNDFYRDEVVIKISSIGEPFTVLADVEYLSMLTHNLLQNALRHGKGKVVVTLTLQDTKIYLIVEDNGSGIPVAERENVLKPFYRVTSTAQVKGHGMGLAIVARVAHWHKADIVLADSAELGGLKISIIFPSI